jgi:hypothetical protein
MIVFNLVQLYALSQYLGLMAPCSSAERSFPRSYTGDIMQEAVYRLPRIYLLKLSEKGF